MIQVRIHSLNVDALTNSPVVLLADIEDEDRRVLPIWIGHAEAMAIMMRLQGVEAPRPLTHDLLRDMIEALGFMVERVEITRLEERTFFAAIVLRGEDKRIALDARPSDSMALAVRVGAPIYVADDVWESSALESETGSDEEEEVERFRTFLDHVEPSDFES